MSVAELYNQLLESNEFRTWHQQHPDCYLVHFFTQTESGKDPHRWEIGYYNPKNDKITTFVLDRDIQLRAEDDVFKDKHAPLEKLEIESVHKEYAEARRIAQELQQTNYTKQIALAGITILQRLEGQTLWNLTLVTNAFNAINIRIDAASGQVVSHQLTSFFDMQPKKSP